ncbi:protein Lst7p [[Candida] railenensis]|uniref:Protein Lst7p n=1 Tax=[Candida] railenensis TaxID=45579 RepID=A0A9P0VVS6_9ASCO|nr:protein Lst7p [[Candida] railenensis]
MANYMVCLAHFCELHGPSTIICTQKVAEPEKSSLFLPANSMLQTCQSCKLTLPDDSVNLQSTIGGTSYVSTQYPASSQRYSSLTKLVMKTLSVETTSDISKPIFFGDVVNGYCINKIFKISDANARGGERKYSLMVVSDKEKDLLLHWDDFSIYLNEFILLIQQQAQYVTDELNPKKSKPPATSSASTSGNNQTSNTATFDNERYLRRSLIKPKSLIDLTNDNELFVKIHLWAIELLKDV